MKRRRKQYRSSPKARRLPKLLWFLLGVALVAVVLFTGQVLRKPQPSVADPQAQWDLRQQTVSQVIRSADRTALIGSSATQGNPDADIILFEFSDFQCPYCARASLDVQALMEKHGEDVLFVYKHFPLMQIHPEAMPAARAAWAAAQQDQFWIYHDGLFANQARLGENLYSELAQQIGLDLETFDRDRNSSASLAAVQRDLQLAQSMALNGTPTFLLNDLLMPPGTSLTLLEETLNRIQTALQPEPETSPSEPDALPSETETPPVETETSPSTP
ncbi:MAG TPA: thioredoxin domain-containing protein [Trichocoleus sp.]